ncbi:MAG: 3-hydroxybutyryl-CoA dehydrogenase [Candidatus Poseidoniia archaeon]|jgi:3-hydroxybutyryl-CoA dehydrogenase|nr:3-hydroxybutyryl-CoA dehydrogenase [Candidatus Poseidoniia archaeon]MDP6441798.1 3-hydroxybutyryl-CoA dehydrogenase [Candidatus Poseidoniia archaeon]MDP7096587.1 3-hydroxybutyryl-CoA dehydrogenase [Candidatus Poseidoniia archaeon]MDP7187944.1 3-hydroxybutyryl-CoA dehydrogenase [Candidatus Poseidoniia archaeon]MDP7445011.1 3-hydroxybutyryl-CoA dehydrogenase [Candidatus Poseidoniia archaeon]|tara:strand:+ start:957 stop:1805 length:849 start_codon:yes stop_codon:yes gene_type:complete
MKVKSVGVIGAGQMGAGIAQVCAAIDRKVILCDIKQEFVDNGLKTINRNLERSVTKERIVQEDMDETLANIQTTLKLGDLSECDIIIEAIVENVDIKKKLFQDLGKSCKDDAILASNTSSIPIGILAEVSERPELVVGMHFMNPVPVMKLVEVIRAKSTNDSTFEATFKLAEDLNKVPVLVNDFPGFVSNRILLPMLNEAMFCVMEGVAEPEAVDTVMKLGMSHPMGPLTLADFIGLDTCLAIMEVLHKDLDDDKYRPCPLLIKMVKDGKLGKKSGEGFYKY